MSTPEFAPSLITPVESVAMVTRKAAASVPAPIGGIVPFQSTLRTPPPSSTLKRPVESVATVTLSAVASTPAPIGGAVPFQVIPGVLVTST